MNVNGKVIMITGAGGGLGSEMARVLSRNGAQILTKTSLSWQRS